MGGALSAPSQLQNRSIASGCRLPLSSHRGTLPSSGTASSLSWSCLSELSGFLFQLSVLLNRQVLCLVMCILTVIGLVISLVWLLILMVLSR